MNYELLKDRLEKFPSEPERGFFEEWCDWLGDRNDLAKDIFDSLQGKIFSVNQNQRIWLIVHPSTKGPGTQISYFDDKGALMDSQFPEWSDAVARLIEDVGSVSQMKSIELALDPQIKKEEQSEDDIPRFKHLVKMHPQLDLLSEQAKKDLAFVAERRDIRDLKDIFEYYHETVAKMKHGEDSPMFYLMDGIVKELNTVTLFQPTKAIPECEYSQEHDCPEGGR